MHFLIRGYDRQTLEPRMEHVEGVTEDAAVRNAGDSGIIVESIEPVAIMGGRREVGLRSGTGTPGELRDRYLLGLAWLCRVGGGCLVGFTLYMVVVIVQQGEPTFETWWTAGALGGVGASVMAAGELLAELPSLRRADKGEAES